eukprot:scaffold38315_cov29-Tisochrysis_lutea.AAC.7
MMQSAAASTPHRFGQCSPRPKLGPARRRRTESLPSSSRRVLLVVSEVVVSSQAAGPRSGRRPLRHSVRAGCLGADSSPETLCLSACQRSWRVGRCWTPVQRLSST